MKVVTLIVLFTWLSLANAQTNLVSNALGSFMVLQRAPERAQIWGTTAPGASVSVTFKNVNYTSQAGSSGRWSVLLPATPAGGPFDIPVTSSNGQRQVLQNVLFGDVYVCSGQSNMQFTVHSAFNATQEIADADKYPDIRIFTAGQHTISETPLYEFGTIDQKWSIASSKTVGVGDWTEFSAVCWFFGRDLQNKIKVPIGLVSSNWGGTIVATWSSPDAIAKCKQPEEDQDSFVEKDLDSTNLDPNHPSLLWNAMISPLLPMTIKGAAWYQGEQNSGQAQYYSCAFPAMVADWRLKWSKQVDPQFGFYFVQLAPWTQGNYVNEPDTRLAQLFALSLPKVGFATAMDLGDKDAPYGSVHPRNKQPVGARLALAALGITYQQNVQYLGPMAQSFKVLSQNPPSAQVEIEFIPRTVGSGLTHHDFVCPVPGQCSEYEIEVGGVWKAAQLIQTKANSVVISVSLSAASAVTGVRYGYSNYPTSTLYNKEGLPAIPFSFPNPITQNQ